MKKVMILMILVVISLALASCEEKDEAPINLSEYVSVSVVDNNFVFETKEAERKLGRSYEFYTWKNMGNNVVSLFFYNKNAEIIGYANVNLS